MTEHSIALSRRAFTGLAAAFGLAACAGFHLPDQAFAVTSAEKQAEANAALTTLNAMEGKLAEAESNYGNALAELDAATARMEEAQARIEETTAQIAELQEHLGTRARSMYRTGSTTFIDLLLGSASFQDFATNWDLLNDLNQQDADMVDETKRLRTEIEAQKAEYERQAQIAQQKTDEMAAIVAEAEALYAQQETIYQSLSAEAAQLLQQEQEAAERARQAQIQAQLAAQQAAANNNGNNNGGGGQSNQTYYTEPAYVASTGNSIVDRAKGWLGRAQYVWGACSPGAFDCSGFVSYCVSGAYSRLGTTMTFLGWNQVSDPQPGDIAVNAGHTGIYVGGGQMIHAAGTGQGVIQSSVQSGMIFVRP